MHLSLFTMHVFTLVLCLWSLLQINVTFNLSGILFVAQSAHCLNLRY